MFTQSPFTQFIGSMHSSTSVRTNHTHMNTGKHCSSKYVRSNHTHMNTGKHCSSKCVRSNYTHMNTGKHCSSHSEIGLLNVPSCTLDTIEKNSQRHSIRTCKYTMGSVRVQYLCSFLRTCLAHSHRHRCSGTFRGGSCRCQTHRCYGRCTHRYLQRKGSILIRGNNT